MSKVGGLHEINELLFFQLNHKFLGIITQLKTYFDACSRVYL